MVGAELTGRGTGASPTSATVLRTNFTVSDPCRDVIIFLLHAAVYILQDVRTSALEKFTG